MPGQSREISVVIPLYNKGHVLQSTMTSVLAQSIQHFEVIVVDDGSTDDGPELVEAIDDPRIQLIRQANQGVSAARNRGVLEARGKWIAFLDADDLWAPTHLEELISAVKYSEVIAAFTNFIFEGRALPSVKHAIPSQRVDDYFSFALSNGGYSMFSSAVLARRDQLIECGLFAVGEPFGEDIDMWCRLALRGPFQYVASPSVTYRDVLVSSAVTRQLKKGVPFPVFARRLSQMIADGEVPSHLVNNARRYVNFLLLEYVLQLLDRGELIAARRILLRHCTLAWDSKRYLRRLIRTVPVGQRMFRTIQDMRVSRSLQKSASKSQRI